MRKLLLSALILFFMSATAFAGGWGWNNHKIQTRWGTPVEIDSTLCRQTIAWAKVHDKGAQFNVVAWGCTPGDVLTVWGIAGSDPELGADNITVNCGGGIVLPDGRFKTVCDVPIGNIDDQIPPCTESELPWPGGCAQVLAPGHLVDPLREDFFIDILTHNALDPEISMAQIRTLNTCFFFGGPDTCARVALIKFAAR